jgi:hypothetical protein
MTFQEGRLISSPAEDPIALKEFGLVSAKILFSPSRDLLIIHEDRLLSSPT